MSNLIQVTCPKCGTKIRVRRPSASRATARCMKCQSAVTFNVPAASPQDGFPDFAGAMLPQPNPLSASAVAPARPLHAPLRPMGQSANARGNVWIKPLLLAMTMLVATVVVGTGVWLLVKNIPTMRSIALFDSPQQILDVASENDQRLRQIITAFGSEAVPKETEDELIELAQSSRRLVHRAVLLNPLSENEAKNLIGTMDGNPADDKAPIGPLSESDRTTLVSKVLGIPKEQQQKIKWSATQTIASNQFVREYLRFGHIELKSSPLAGEQIEAQRIEILRELNRLLANAAKTVDMQDTTTTPPLTKEQAMEKFDATYDPILDDIVELAERMRALAEQRYELPKNQVGDDDYYGDVLYYTMQANVEILGRSVVLSYDDNEIFKQLRAVLVAEQQIDRAAMGMKPTWIEAAEKEEAARVAKIATQAEARNAEIEQEKNAREKALADANRKAEKQAADRAMAESSQSAESSVASNDPTGLAPPPRGPGPGIGRFGSRAPGGFGLGGAGPRGMGEQSGNANDPGRRFGPPSSFGSRLGGPRPSPPPFDPKTGVTIRMKDAGQIDTRTVHQQFQELRCSSRSSVSNGELTLQLSYNGSLDEVVKLIQFGTVVSKDEDTRTIIVAKK